MPVFVPLPSSSSTVRAASLFSTSSVGVESAAASCLRVVLSADHHSWPCERPSAPRALNSEPACRPLTGCTRNIIASLHPVLRVQSLAPVRLVHVPTELLPPCAGTLYARCCSFRPLPPSFVSSLLPSYMGLIPSSWVSSILHLVSFSCYSILMPHGAREFI